MAEKAKSTVETKMCWFETREMGGISVVLTQLKDWRQRNV